MAEHKTASGDTERHVGAVANACDILDFLYDNKGARVTAISDELGLNKGTVHTQLTTLRDRGYVHKRDVVYYPSMRFLEVGEGVKSRMEVFRSARDELLDIAEQTGEYAHLMIEQNGWGYIIHKEKGDKAATTTSRAGKKLHLHYTSTGKAILAHLPEERVQEIVEQRGLPERTEKPRSRTRRDPRDGRLVRQRRADQWRTLRWRTHPRTRWDCVRGDQRLWPRRPHEWRVLRGGTTGISC